jgi:hypothetical protein
MGADRTIRKLICIGLVTFMCGCAETMILLEPAMKVCKSMADVVCFISDSGCLTPEPKPELEDDIVESGKVGAPDAT